jgi:hypothetical protein
MQCRALALHALGRTHDADAERQAFIDKYGSDQPEFVATLYANRGEAAAAFEWLDKAVAGRDVQISSSLSEPLLEPLHGDARWVPFLRKIGYAPEQLAKIELKVTLPQ